MPLSRFCFSRRWTTNRLQTNKVRRRALLDYRRHRREAARLEQLDELHKGSGARDWATELQRVLL